MNVREHVINLGLARRLKDLGVDQKSLFIWTEKTTVRLGKHYSVYYSCYNPPTQANDYCAYTASELLEIMPQDIEVKKRFDDYLVSYCDPKNDSSYKHAVDDHLSNALAKMLINLIESNLITKEP